MRLYDDAVVYYDRASDMLPNRFYPLVRSSATKQMFNEAY